MKITTICNEHKGFRVRVPMLIRLLALGFILLTANHAFTQNCTTLGQTPSTAFPVCGESVFSQTNVPICVTHSLVVPGCDDAGTGNYQDKNPFYYKFTCFTAGTLGFLITPTDLGDDYDWMLYDITGRNPQDIFTDKNLIVTGNWAGTYGITGASNAGVSYIECGSDPTQKKNTFAKMPTLIVGHTYLLMISHFTDSQIGYKLSFGGGTAVITDPKIPALKDAYGGCGGVTATIVLNKKMKCSSLMADGSDFSLSTSLTTIASAVGQGCSSGFDLDTIVLTMSSPLPPGDYNVSIKKGGDGNTLLDNCDRSIAEGDVLKFTVFPIVPTLMDSITPISCAPNELQLVFKKPMLCSAIADDGSDFTVTGPTPVTISNAKGNCVNGLTTTIKITLSAPIQTAGLYTIRLVTGNDGNTVIDECGQQTPAGATLPFTAADTVNASFTTSLLYGCKFDTVVCNHPGGNGINRWSWNFNNEGTSTLQNDEYYFNVFNEKTITLVVSNDLCSDSVSQKVLLDNAIHAAFGAPEILCPEELAVFTDSSSGKINSWEWDLGNNTSSLLQNPTPFNYARSNIRSRKFNIQLIIGNEHNCFDTTTRQVELVNTCIIDVPNAFSPNGDGNNDYLYPLNAFKAINLQFKVYNRFGQLVFETNNWKKRWDGTVNGKPQSTGQFVWTLTYTHKDTGKQFSAHGVTLLIR